MINILRTVVSRVKRMSAEGRFSVRCAENCGNDRLHRREVNVYMPYIRQLAVTKTVVMAMKDRSSMEIRCRSPESISRVLRILLYTLRLLSVFSILQELRLSRMLEIPRNRLTYAI